jgi:hypothetical protein
VGRTTATDSVDFRSSNSMVVRCLGLCALYLQNTLLASAVDASPFFQHETLTLWGSLLDVAEITIRSSSGSISTSPTLLPASHPQKMTVVVCTVSLHLLRLTIQSTIVSHNLSVLAPYFDNFLKFSDCWKFSPSVPFSLQSWHCWTHTEIDVMFYINLR